MMGVLSGVMTTVLIVIFVGIWGWAWSKRNKSTFDTMAQLPLQDDAMQTEGDQERTDHKAEQSELGDTQIPNQRGGSHD